MNICVTLALNWSVNNNHAAFCAICFLRHAQHIFSGQSADRLMKSYQTNQPWYWTKFSGNWRVER